MRRTGLKFEWNNGSQNGSAIKVLKDNKIDWHYDHFCNLVADFYGIGTYHKVGYEHIENDVFEICMKV